MNRLRNTFNKKPTAVNDIPPVNNENLRPSATPYQQPSAGSSFTSRTSSSLSIKRKEEPVEYKLSVINGDTYLPPSPPEKKSFWPKTSRQNSHRSLLNENEPFSISRESFESYRRSFDISARSPVIPQDPPTPRRSLDTRFAKSPNLNSPRFDAPDPMEEEVFEDVGLENGTQAKDDLKQQSSKKRGIFSRFGDQNQPPGSSSPGDVPRPGSSHRGFHIPGRKRGQSGQGAELGNIDQLDDKRNGEDGAR